MILGSQRRACRAAVAAAAILASLFAVPGARADNGWWNTSTGTWTNTASWWTTAAGSTAVAAVPTTSNTATFNGTGVNGAQTIYLNGAQAAGRLTFANTGATTLLGGVAATPASNTLTLGASGITVNAGAGVVTIGGSSAAVPIALGADQTWTNNSANLVTVVNGISGSFGLTKSGTGRILLSGSNTYTGTTTASAGTLQVSTTNALPGFATANRVVVGSSGTLAVNYGGASDWNAAAVTSLLSNNGGGFASGATLGFDTTSASGTYSTNIAVASIRLAKLGSNSLTLSGSNSYGGGTQVNAGTLVVNNAAALGSGTVNVNAGSITFAASTAAATGLPTIAVATSNNTTAITLNAGVTINNPIISGAGGQNALSVNSGTATVNGPITWSSGQDLRINGGGTLILNGTITNTDTTAGIMFNRSGGTVVVNTPANYVGGGTWAAGNNSAPETTTVYSGTVRLGVSQAFNQKAVLNFGVAAALLDLNGKDQSIQNATANMNLSDRYGMV